MLCITNNSNGRRLICHLINEIEPSQCCIFTTMIYIYNYAETKSTIMTNEHASLEKYTSHTLFKMVAKGLRKCYVWGVSWRLNSDSNILTPSFSVFSSTSFSLCWAAQPGTQRAQPSAESWYSLPRTATTDTKLTEIPVAPCYIIFDFHLLPVGVTSAPNSTRPQSRLCPDIFDRMHLFLDRRLRRRSTCYTNSIKHQSFVYTQLNNQIVLFQKIQSSMSFVCLFVCLVGWVLWHINLCRLFNAKSIFIQIIYSISMSRV